MELKRKRTTQEARQALSDFCKAVGKAGDQRVHIFTIPVDEERDADCILSDVITERDRLREAAQKAVDVFKGKDKPGWSPRDLTQAMADLDLTLR